MENAAIETLEHVYLFQDLSAEDLSQLAQRATLKRFPKNSVLVNEGDDTDSLYIIQSGRVKIYLSDEDGKELVLSLIGPGDYFGEIALLDESPRSASVMSLEECKIYVLNKSQFEAFLKQDTAVCLRVMRGLTRRLRELTDNMRDMALMDVYGRIVKTLTNLAEEQDGKLVITDKLTHKDLASMVGSSREMVSRIMKELSKGGYITVEKNRLIINDKLPARW